MELEYNKYLRLYLWKQYNPSTGRELGKGNKKTLKGYTEVASF